MTSDACKITIKFYHVVIYHKWSPQTVLSWPKESWQEWWSPAWTFTNACMPFLQQCTGCTHTRSRLKCWWVLVANFMQSIPMNSRFLLNRWAYIAAQQAWRLLLKGRSGSGWSSERWPQISYSQHLLRFDLVDKTVIKVTGTHVIDLACCNQNLFLRQLADMKADPGFPSETLILIYCWLWQPRKRSRLSYAEPTNPCKNRLAEIHLEVHH